REDDFNTYVYKSEDSGRTWSALKGNLPDMVVNDLIQDPANPDLLYLGGDLGLYVSLDGGERWIYISRIPNVAVYDLIVHPRDNELVVATHGRSMFVMDVKLLQEIAGNSDELQMWGTERVRYSEQWGERRFEYLEPYEPEIVYFVYSPEEGNASFEVQDSTGNNVYSRKISLKSGVNRITWDLKRDRPGKDESPYIGKDEYQVVLKTGEKSANASFEVR
ncbi:MAG: glycosyl hydrolase, partial [Cyclobacteriaceae bacterium]